jgi:hypothetical protein
LQEVLEKIQNHFDFLFEDGFTIAEAIWPKGFANWTVYLRSYKFIARIDHDRGEISLGLTFPRTHGKSLSELGFFDAQIVIGYFSRNIHYVFFKKSEQDLDIQLAGIASELKPHYEKVCSFFEKSNYLLLKEDFETFSEEVREYDLGQYGYKSRKK